MLNKINISKEIKGSFQRIFRLIPKKLQTDEYIVNIAAIYLKIGGEKLAKQTIEVFKAIDNLEVNQTKRKIRNEALLRALEVKKAKEISNNENYSE